MRKKGFEGQGFKRPIRLWIEGTVKGAADFLVEVLGGIATDGDVIFAGPEAAERKIQFSRLAVVGRRFRTPSGFCRREAGTRHSVREYRMVLDREVDRARYEAHLVRLMV